MAKPTVIGRSSLRGRKVLAAGTFGPTVIGPAGRMVESIRHTRLGM
jgi:hypothetical protein